MAQLGNVFDILQFNFHAVKGRAAANPIVVQCPGHAWLAATGAARFALVLRSLGQQPPLWLPLLLLCHGCWGSPLLAAGEALTGGEKRVLSVTSKPPVPLVPLVSGAIGAGQDGWSSWKGL